MKESIAPQPESQARPDVRIQSNQAESRLNLAGIMGLLRKKGGPFEQWGNDLGEPHEDKSFIPAIKRTRKEKLADAGREPLAFEPTLEAEASVVLRMKSFIEDWMQETGVSEDEAMAMWGKVLDFAQGLGRPRLYKALDQAVHEKFLGES